MASKKKGCGFLIVALLLLIVGGGVAGFLGWSAKNSGEDFFESLNNEGEMFVTPLPLTYTPEEGGKQTVWLISTSDAPDLSGIEIELTDKSTGNTTEATKSSTTVNLGNAYYVADIEVEKGKDYIVKATGVDSGTTFRISNKSPSTVLSMFGKGIGAFVALGIGGVLALIFGIIGLIMLLSSGNKTQPAV